MKYVLYLDTRGEWRWRFVTNGRTIADSGEGYRNQADAERGIEIMKNSSAAPVERPNLLGGLFGAGKP